jgi:CRP-like cAMP-binding protein
MSAIPRPAASRLIAKLESIVALSEDEKRALLDLPIQIRSFTADQDVVREGDRPSRSFLLLDGFVCIVKTTQDGKRQILALHVPGDVPDLQSLHLKTLDNSMVTLTPCQLGFISHEDLQALCNRYSGIASALWRNTLIDAAIFREWMISLGQRQAYSRMAHLLCELLVRLRAVGLARDRICDLPISQSELGDLLGLSTVHVNRVLGELRAAGLIALKGSTFEALDWEGLKRAGEFNPTYLHLEQEQLAG